MGNGAERGFSQVTLERHRLRPVDSVGYDALSARRKEFTMIIRHCEEIAKVKVGIEGWEPFVFEKVNGGLLIEGDIPRTLAKGPRKGKKSWDRVVARHKVVISEGEYQAYYREYEDKTGNCGDCFGDGRVLKSWHHIDGVTYKDCPKCQASGKAS